MQKLTIVIMAAGLGSRYGGMKQIDPVGPNNEMIMDYSIYDALKAGFQRVVFVIKKEMLELFREKAGRKIERVVDTEYVFQDINDVPSGFEVPEGRQKPWGTAHAVISCRNSINTPFAVINADDFYGRSSFEALYSFLLNAQDTDNEYNYCLMGFLIENTLTEHGHVARGVCSVDKSGYLMEINERTTIKKFGDTAKYTEDGENWIVIPPGSIVSMNIWGFTPSFFKEIEEGFPKFLELSKNNLLKAEYYLPFVVDKLISQKKARVKVLASKEKWYGVTYLEDKEDVKKAIGRMIQSNIYPAELWSDLP